MWEICSRDAPNKLLWKIKFCQRIFQDCCEKRKVVHNVMRQILDRHNRY